MFFFFFFSLMFAQKKCKNSDKWQENEWVLKTLLHMKLMLKKSLIKNIFFYSSVFPQLSILFSIFSLVLSDVLSIHLISCFAFYLTGYFLFAVERHCFRNEFICSVNLFFFFLPFVCLSQTNFVSGVYLLFLLLPKNFVTFL